MPQDEAETMVDKAQEESGEEEEATEETTEETAEETQTQETDDTTDESSEDSRLDELKDQAPEHLFDDDGNLNEEEVLKQNLGFRKKQSQGELEEAIEFYEEYGDEIEELQELEDVDEDLSELDEDEEQEEDVDEEDEDEETDELEVPESPDDYEMNLDDMDDEDLNVDIDPAMEKNAKQAAHEAGLSQDQFESFVKNWESNFQDVVEETQVDPEEELKKLSEDKQEAKKMVRQVVNYVDQKHEDGYISDEERQELHWMAETAEGTSALLKIMQKNEAPTDIPTDTNTVGGETVQDVRQEIQELKQSEAYQDRHHENHQQAQKKERELYQKLVEMQEE